MSTDFPGQSYVGPPASSSSQWGKEGNENSPSLAHRWLFPLAALRGRESSLREHCREALSAGNAWFPLLFSSSPQAAISAPASAVSRAYCGNLPVVLASNLSLYSLGKLPGVKMSVELW